MASTTRGGGLGGWGDILANPVGSIRSASPGSSPPRRAAELSPAESGPRTRGMVLMQHGLFSFGETARESYESMIELVTRAEEYLARHQAWHVPGSARAPAPVPASARSEIAALRHSVSSAARVPLILAIHRHEQCLGFAQRADLE